jgi:hypothetical protein|tara:strand:+ start:675 stop:893 length:219 start_codon:yes stop_codon:yes gene_type:complete
MVFKPKREGERKEKGRKGRKPLHRHIPKKKEVIEKWDFIKIVFSTTFFFFGPMDLNDSLFPLPARCYYTSRP